MIDVAMSHSSPASECDFAAKNWSEVRSDHATKRILNASLGFNFEGASWLPEEQRKKQSSVRRRVHRCAFATIQDLQSGTRVILDLGCCNVQIHAYAGMLGSSLHIVEVRPSRVKGAVSPGFLAAEVSLKSLNLLGGASGYQFFPRSSRQHKHAGSCLRLRAVRGTDRSADLTYLIHARAYLELL